MLLGWRCALSEQTEHIPLVATPSQQTAASGPRLALDMHRGPSAPSHRAQDAGLPLMCSRRFPEDTLFLVFEEDWRLRPEPPARVQQPGAASAAASSSGAASSSAAPYSGHGDCSGSPQHEQGEQAVSKRPRGKKLELPHRAGFQQWQDVGGGDLNGLVSIANEAHRAGCGDLVWFTWQPHGAGDSKNCHRRQSPRSGAMLIGLSQTGAKQLLEACRANQLPPGHWDVVLLRYLYKAAMRSCYVYPPVGNYATHISGCERSMGAGTGGRPSCWDEAFACPGTTVEEDPQRRPKWFGRFQASGPAVQLAACEPPAAGTPWRTFWGRRGEPRPDLLTPGFPVHMDKTGLTKRAMREVRQRQTALQLRIYVEEAREARGVIVVFIDVSRRGFPCMRPRRPDPSRRLLNSSWRWHSGASCPGCCRQVQLDSGPTELQV